MANRIPLVLDETNSRLQELPNGDDLNLAGNNIVGLTSLTTTSGITVGGSIDVVGSANANTVNATNGNFTNIEATNISGVDTLSTVTLIGDVVAVGTNFTIGGAPLADVALSGSYLDLRDQPAGLEQVQSDWAELNPDSLAFIQNKPTIPGNLTDLGIFDGDPGQILSTDGNANFAFIDPPQTGSNVASFTDLDDVPASYTGFTGNVLAVNATEDGLIYFNLSTLALTSLQVTNALGFTPYPNTNPDNYINTDAGIIDALGYTPYNGVANPQGFLTAEIQNLDDVVQNGATTTAVIGVGGINSAGSIAIDPGGSLTVGGDIQFSQSSGTILIDGNSGSTLKLGQSSRLQLSSSSTILQSATMIPDITAGTLPSLGSITARYGDLYIQAVNMSSSLTHTGTMDFTVATDLNITATNGDITLDSNRAVTMNQLVNFLNVTAAQRDAITGEQSGDVAYVADDRTLQMYVGNFDGSPQWVSLNIPYGPEPSTGSVYAGMLAVADGTNWDPAGDGQEHLMCYLNGAFVQVA